jgi:uncharacterized protein (DUF58 family)
VAENYFNPVVASRLAGYEIRSRRLAEGFKEGLHKSRLIGVSTSFAQHRPYVPGDDLRRFDWKILAKTDRYFIRQYEADTNLSCLFLLDTSASMFFKGDGSAMSKYDYAATITATLGYMLFEQKDPFGLVLFDDKVRTALPARSTGGHLRNFFDSLSKAEAGTQTNLGRVMLSVGPRLKRRGIVVIVSDFLSDMEQLTLGLGQLSFMGQDVLLFLVEDPVERDFPFSGSSIMLGPEKEGQVLCDPRDYSAVYQRERLRHHDALRETARRFGYFFEEMPTDGAMDEALGAVLAARLVHR